MGGGGSSLPGQKETYIKRIPRSTAIVGLSRAPFRTILELSSYGGKGRPAQPGIRNGLYHHNQIHSLKEEK